MRAEFREGIYFIVDDEIGIAGQGYNINAALAVFGQKLVQVATSLSDEELRAVFGVGGRPRLLQLQPLSDGTFALPESGASQDPEQDDIPGT